ncbi:hypothetical protein BCV72DRAFT_14350 [Rhizopus microsporus var. microsporus]|uniref:Sodium/sulfate symporter n=1 Tax=Rhizopus microsporus var. microsporus TaxID=86635 RepID=A0A1X0QXM8_RHIZD|nr:hypothetical protein BCV72DRAFT_14350 [Rhizopus microsporus var. microsporus]
MSHTSSLQQDGPNEHTSLLPCHIDSKIQNRQLNDTIRQTNQTNTTIYILNCLRHSDLIRLLPSIAIGCSIWFGMSPSEELTVTAIRLLSIFVSCIFALITTSINISVLVLTSLTLLSLTQSFQCRDRVTGESMECRLCGQADPLTGSVYDCKGRTEAFHHSLAGFSSPVVWLIFAAFHLGKAVEVTQLGRRMSLLMIKLFGKHIIGLAYAILFSELLLGPFVPSNTARGGGIVLPIVRSIAASLGSTPLNDPKPGSYLMLMGAHANLLSASMYLTGMAPNPIVLSKATKLFPDLKFDFTTWLIGSSVPVLTCAILLPFLLYWLCGLYGKKDRIGKEVIEHAKKELSDMGSMSMKEFQLCFVLLMCLALWVTSNYTNMDSTLVALIGIVILLHLKTIEWKDIATNTSAWETLFWLGGLITIAGQLSEAGASTYLGLKISHAISHFHLPAVPALGIAYFLTTFMFSSLSAHTIAFAGTFLDAGHALGANPMILTCLVAYFGALSGCMTNFSTGTVAMYFAPGFVSSSKWFRIGGQLAVFYLFIYFTIGLGWWSLLGWNSKT